MGTALPAVSAPAADRSEQRAVWSRGAADCGDDTLTQSTDPNVVQFASVWCGTADVSGDTSLARGFTAPYALNLACVTFGVRQCTVADWPVRVRVLFGQPTDPYASLALVAETEVVIPVGTDRQLFTAPMQNVYIPAGTDFVVEIAYDSRVIDSGGDGGLLTLGFNNLGQSAPCYIRSTDCSLGEFETVASVGFPNNHLVMSVGVNAFEPTRFEGFRYTPTPGTSLEREDQRLILRKLRPHPGAIDPLGATVEYGTASQGLGAPTIEWPLLPTGGSEWTQFFGNGTADTFGVTTLDTRRMAIDVDFGEVPNAVFDVSVYNGTDYVGTIPDQTSGSLIYEVFDRDPPVDPALRPIIDIYRECRRVTRNGVTFTEYCWVVVIDLRDLWGGRFVSGRGDVGFEGDTIVIERQGSPLTSASPSITIQANVDGYLVLKPGAGAFFGSGPSNPVGSGPDLITDVGAPIRLTPESTDSDLIVENTTTGDKKKVRKLQPCYCIGSSGQDGVDVRLGGVGAATLDLSYAEFDLTHPGGPCMTFEAVQVDGTSGGSMSYDPCLLCPPPFGQWPWSNLLGDFTGVGAGTYTLQVLDHGVIVHEETGVQSQAGAVIAWPNKLGKLGGPTPCLVSCYPDGTLMYIASTGSTVAMNEVRMLAEGAGPIPPIAHLRINTAGVIDMTFEDITTELAGPPTCPADITNDGLLNFFDIAQFVGLFQAQQPQADFNNDGLFNFFDFSSYLAAFNAGCP